MIVLAALYALGLLSLAAATVPPARVPWRVVAEPLIMHRSNLATIGLGAIVTALLGLNVAVVF